MKDTFLFDYLQKIITPIEEEVRPYLHYPFIVYDPEQSDTHPFRALKTVKDQATQNIILMPYRYFNAYGFLYYLRIPNIIVYSNVNGQRLEKVRGQGFTDFDYLCLEKASFTPPPESGEWIAALYTWLLSKENPLTEKKEILAAYDAYLAGIRRVLKNEKITLSELLSEMLGLYENTNPSKEDHLSIQKHFWMHCDNKTKEQLIRSTKTEKIYIHQLFDFSYKESYDLFYRFFSEIPEEWMFKLLEIRLGQHEIRAIRAKLQRTEKYRQLPLDLSQDQETVMQAIVTFYCSAEASHEKRPFCVHFEELRRKYHTHNFGLALKARGALETDLIKDLLLDLTLSKSPAQALLTLFGGQSSLYVRISIFYHTLTEQQPDLYLKLNTDLSLLSFDAFTAECFEDRPMLFERLLYEALAMPNFILCDTLFALLVYTYHALTERAREHLIDQLLCVFSRLPDQKFNTQKACLASLFCLDHRRILPKILTCMNEVNGSYIKSEVLAFCLIQYCQYTNDSLINFLQDHFADFNNQQIKSVFAALNTEGVPALLNTDAIDALLNSTEMLDETLALLYFNHLMLVMNETVEASIENVLKFLVYCKLIFGGNNLFLMLFEKKLIPEQGPAIQTFSQQVVLHAARQWTNFLDSNDENLALYKLLVTDFLSFMRSCSYTHVKRPLDGICEILRRDFSALGLYVNLDVSTPAQELRLFKPIPRETPSVENREAPRP